MGLDTTHNAWSGPYSSFNNWRRWIADKIGIPLDLMEGFYYDEPGSFGNPFALLEDKFPSGDDLAMSALRRIKKTFPLKWESFKPSPLHELLFHSDCDGYIEPDICGEIALALKELLGNISDDNADSAAPNTARGTYDGMYRATERFIKGCELAHSNGEKLRFH
jgi:hypothetical protein